MFENSIQISIQSALVLWGLIFVYLTIRSAATGRPVVVKSKIITALLALCFAPSLIYALTSLITETVLLPQDFPLFLSALFCLIVFLLLFTHDEYTFIGVTAEELNGILMGLLPKLDLNFSVESEGTISIPALGEILEISENRLLKHTYLRTFFKASSKDVVRVNADIIAAIRQKTITSPLPIFATNIVLAAYAGITAYLI